jgi:hypothetical protein
MGTTLFVKTVGLPGKSEYDIALSSFRRIQQTFPSLTMNLDLHPQNVELEMNIPVQPGLSFKVYLNLQNGDELHVAASVFWVEWFPCTRPDRVDSYLEAVCGLLSGEFRILEHWRGKRAVKAQLQSPSDGGWKTIATWGDVSAIVPWPRKASKVVQNRRPPILP